VKSLLLSLVAIASTLAWHPREVSAPMRPQDPPVDCFLCGIDVRLHAAVLSTATRLNASVALRALSAFYG
jgi:hypothetical protein